MKPLNEDSLELVSAFLAPIYGATPEEQKQKIISVHADYPNETGIETAGFALIDSGGTTCDVYVAPHLLGATELAKVLETVKQIAEIDNWYDSDAIKQESLVNKLKTLWCETVVKSY